MIFGPANLAPSQLCLVHADESNRNAEKRAGRSDIP